MNKIVCSSCGKLLMNKVEYKEYLDLVELDPNDDYYTMTDYLVDHNIYSTMLVDGSFCESCVFFNPKSGHYERLIK